MHLRYLNNTHSPTNQLINKVTLLIGFVWPTAYGWAVSISHTWLLLRQEAMQSYLNCTRYGPYLHDKHLDDLDSAATTLCLYDKN